MIVDVLHLAATAVILAATLAVFAVGIAYPAGVLESVPRLGWFGSRKRLESVAAWCPGLVILLFGALILVWRDTPFYFPHPDYYRVAAEVIPIALVALIIERSVLERFSARVLVIYGLLFVAGEVAAFLAISQSIKGSAPAIGHVGGTHHTSELLSILTTSALIAAAVLSAAAVVARGSEDRGPTPRRSRRSTAGRRTERRSASSAARPVQNLRRARVPR